MEKQYQNHKLNLYHLISGYYINSKILTELGNTGYPRL